MGDSGAVSQLLLTSSSSSGEALPNPLEGHLRYEKVRTEEIWLQSVLWLHVYCGRGQTLRWRELHSWEQVTLRSMPTRGSVVTSVANMKSWCFGVTSVPPCRSSWHFVTFTFCRDRRADHVPELSGAQVQDLGKGSQGFVLLANDKFTGERVAIKFLPRGVGVGVVGRSHSEAALAAERVPWCGADVLGAPDSENGPALVPRAALPS